VAGGLTKKQAIDEAIRCPQCAEPACNQGCPVGIDIPAFIRLLREGNPSDALEKIREANHLTAICGRMCSAPCETACILNEENAPISIRALERYAWDQGHKRGDGQGAKGKGQGLTGKVAVVGSGPSGLTAAVELSQLGIKVTVFESLHLAGGVLRYGIPAFRLPPKVFDSELEYVQSLGIEIKTNTAIGQSYSLKELFEMEYSVILLALGAGVPQFSQISGENLSGVYFAEEFLMRVNLMKANQYPAYGTSLCVGKQIAVIGGGMAALDCARIAVRLGKEAFVIHEGTEEDMRVRKEEREYAKEEGVKLEILSKVLEILPDEKKSVKAVKCMRMDFADPDSTGQWKIMAAAGSEFILEADTVIMAQGHGSNTNLVKSTEELRLNKNGTIWTHKNSFMTSIPGVFVGGDCETGPGPVVRAMGKGKEVAREINNYLKRHILSPSLTLPTRGRES